MPAENVEAARKGFEAFRRSGEQALFAYLDPDVEMTPLRELPGAEVYHGHDGFRRFFQTLRDAFGEFTWEPQDFLGADDDVLVVTRFVAEGAAAGSPWR